jgi:hypothetical protein
MKEKNLVTSAVALLAAVVILAAGNTDVIYIAVSIALFALGIAYAEGCGKL